MSIMINVNLEDVLHYKEPSCALKEAMENGKINKYRYDFYIKTLEEIMEEEKNKW